MSSPGLLLLLVGGIGLAALLTGNLDRALQRIAGAPPTDNPDAGGRSMGGSWDDAAPAPAGSAPSSSVAGVQAARAAYNAGFRGEALVTALAIARGESGWRADAVGDVAIAGGQWGPSIGLWQIRSLVAQTGTGRERDAAALRNPAHNARSAWTISRGATDWRPWTVYNTGAYRSHLSAARAAAAAAGLYRSASLEVL